jgi:hypothetical protein
MTWEQTVAVISIIIAVYGAAVSTILGIREVKRERRKVKIILEYVAFYEYGQLIVVNTGHRPITLVNFGMTVNKPLREGNPNSERFWDDVPANAFFEGDEPFPVTIQDGGQIAVKFSAVISPMIYDRETKIKLHLFDAEGNVYTEFERRLNNPQWGTLSKI